MSLDLKVYVNQIADDIIPTLVKKLNEFKMICEIYPDFSFITFSGFLPFKFQLTDSKFSILNDKDLISGFEFYIDDFDLQQEKQKLQPKQSFTSKLFGKKEEKPFHSIEIDNKLRDCKKVLSFVWHGADSFELRFVYLTSAIITQITNGVCCYPTDDIWYDNKTILDDAWKELKDYENSLPEKDLEYHLFEGWG